MRNTSRCEARNFNTLEMEFQKSQNVSVAVILARHVKEREFTPGLSGI